MKALTIYQPWASLIAIGAKRFETRGRAIKYRGDIAIHAGLKKPSEILAGADTTIIMTIGKAFGLDDNIDTILRYVDSLPRGGIIAKAELEECWNIHPIKPLMVSSNKDRRTEIKVPDNERLFGNFTPCRFEWELENVKPLSHPIVARGQQGLWNWEEENNEID